MSTKNLVGASKEVMNEIDYGVSYSSGQTSGLEI